MNWGLNANTDELDSDSSEGAEEEEGRVLLMDEEEARFTVDCGGAVAPCTPDGGAEGPTEVDGAGLAAGPSSVGPAPTDVGMAVEEGWELETASYKPWKKFIIDQQSIQLLVKISCYMPKKGKNFS